jgi:adenylate cyclase
MSDKRVQRRLAAILAADVVGYSRLMSRDEAGTLARLKTIRQEIVDPAIADRSGRLVKLMGDGALVEFASAVDAVHCALEIQSRVGALDTERPLDSRIRFRIGINVGDVIVDGEDIYGDGVNVASRIEALAEPGGICLSRAAADQVRDKVPVRIESIGERTVKNIARPIEVFSVAQEPVDEELGNDRPAPAAYRHASIAVLAFDNMSSDPDQSFFSDGISEDIITDLSKVGDLHVIARNSSFSYRGRAVPIPKIAEELGVRYVVEGSVRTAGNRVRVTAQLIDASTGGHVWADRFDRNLTDIFDVQDELTRQIVDALKVQLTPDDRNRLAHRRTVPVEAYNLFLRGRDQSFLHSRRGNLVARRLLEQAINLSPGYAAAHARIGFTHVIDYVNGWADDPAHSLATGLAASRQAVEMDPEEAQAQFAYAIACLWNRDLDEALSAAERCLALEPSSAEGHLAVAHAQIFSGDPEAAVRTIEAYLQLDPLHPDIALHFLAEANISLGRYEAAVEALKNRLARNPDSATSYNLLSSCYGHLGLIEEARAAWARARRLDPDYSAEERRRVLPFRDPADFERRLEGMRLAGIDV